MKLDKSQYKTYGACIDMYAGASSVIVCTNLEDRPQDTLLIVFLLA
jgi:hypothetical protein